MKRPSFSTRLVMLGALGAALGPLPGGVLAQHVGYPAAFVVPGAVSTGSLALRLGHARSLSSVCGKPADSSATSS
ncbi:hypothetical protein WS54_29470 [Burkholderia sp. NRF60-BP8]|nr:hypothetical protein WS54_29470 [Burkholderia sp. NRF60-BP8]KVL10031.1 hypothetical protein WS95_29850 [Burkholderia sp. MSMB1826]